MSIKSKNLIDAFIRILSDEDARTMIKIELIGAINDSDDFRNRLEKMEIVELIEEAKLKKIDVRKFDIAEFFICRNDNLDYLYVVISPYDLYSNDYILRKIALKDFKHSN